MYGLHGNKYLMILINGANKIVTYIVTRKRIFMSKTHNQHIIPQFLQKNFSIDNDKKKVQIYETPLNPKQSSSIKYASIKHNMSSEYTYGPSQFGENLLSHLEFEASKEIEKMIKSPKKYMRQHPKLPDSMINFMVSLQLRGTHTHTLIKRLVQDLKESMDNHMTLTDKEMTYINNSSLNILILMNFLVMFLMGLNRDEKTFRKSIMAHTNL